MLSTLTELSLQMWGTLMPAAKPQMSDGGKLRDNIRTKRVNLSRSCTTPLSAPSPYSHCALSRETMCLHSPCKVSPSWIPTNSLSQSLPWSEMLRWVFEDRSLPAHLSRDAGTRINHFPPHQHLSHEFALGCRRQLHLCSVSVLQWQNSRSLSSCFQFFYI